MSNPKSVLETDQVLRSRIHEIDGSIAAVENILRVLVQAAPGVDAETIDLVRLEGPPEDVGSESAGYHSTLDAISGERSDP